MYQRRRELQRSPTGELQAGRPKLATSTCAAGAMGKGVDGLSDGSVRPRTVPSSIATLPEPVPTIDPNGNGPRRVRSNSNDRRRRFNVNDVRVRRRSKSRTRSRSAVNVNRDGGEKMEACLDLLLCKVT